jgi:hypothetical protein
MSRIIQVGTLYNGIIPFENNIQNPGVILQDAVSSVYGWVGYTMGETGINGEVFYGLPVTGGSVTLLNGAGESGAYTIDSIEYTSVLTGFGYFTGFTTSPISLDDSSGTGIKINNADTYPLGLPYPARPVYCYAGFNGVDANAEGEFAVQVGFATGNRVFYCSDDGGVSGTALVTAISPFDVDGVGGEQDITLDTILPAGDYIVSLTGVGPSRYTVLRFYSERR